MYKNLRSFFLFLLVAAGISLFAINSAIPQKPKEQRLVNDFANVFTSDEIISLEQKLRQLNDTSSNQLVVVTVTDLGGLTPNEFATELGHSWGVGQAKTDNGVVILIKPKTMTAKGEVFIAVGYGLEGVIPDAVAKRIVEIEMIPLFKQGKMYAGVEAAVHTLGALAAKEYTAAAYLKKHEPSLFTRFFPFLLIIIIFVVISAARRKQYTVAGDNSAPHSSLPFWATLLAFNAMSGGTRGHWNNFSSGGGSFGGFGGGGFGGGGAGGSW